jgi:hypothetical protein
MNDLGATSDDRKIKYVVFNFVIMCDFFWFIYDPERP